MLSELGCVGVETKSFRKPGWSVVRNAMIKSNIDSLTPDKFNGQMFLKEIDQLGNTAKELFGNETGKIHELATKIAKTDNNLTKETIEKYGW